MVIRKFAPLEVPLNKGKFSVEAGVVGVSADAQKTEGVHARILRFPEQAPFVCQQTHELTNVASPATRRAEPARPDLAESAHQSFESPLA